MSIKIKNSEIHKTADDVYKKISEAVVKVIDENKYLEDEVKIYSAAIALVSLSADLLMQTTNLDDFDILSMLTKTLSENLNIDFIIEDDEDSEDNLSLKDKKATIKKTMLN